MDIKKIEAAINHIAAERNLPKEDLVEIIEAAIRTAYKKDYGNKDDIVNVNIDFEAEAIEVSVEKTIVDGEVENPYTQITLEELGEGAEGFEVGDVVEIDVTDTILENEADFGRIASQAARQVIIQKIGESEKAKIYDLFKDKQGEIVNVKVDMVENDKVFLDYNGTQVLLPKSEQVSRDRYTPGMRFFVYVARVEDEGKGDPKVILSRKNINLVVKLFEMNTPELEEGTVEIVKIVREPGFKTKLIVASEFEEIDPAGSLIGPKGTRVKTVVEELSGEKIDVINYSDSDREIIAAALNPAKVIDVNIDEDEGSAMAYITKEDEVRAIGKSGGNVRLAEQLSGYRISLNAVEGEEDEGEEGEEGPAEFKRGTRIGDDPTPESDEAPAEGGGDSESSSEGQDQEAPAEGDDEASEAPSEEPAEETPAEEAPSSEDAQGGEDQPSADPESPEESDSESSSEGQSEEEANEELAVVEDEVPAEPETPTEEETPEEPKE